MATTEEFGTDAVVDPTNRRVATTEEFGTGAPVDPSTPPVTSPTTAQPPSDPVYNPDLPVYAGGGGDRTDRTVITPNAETGIVNGAATDYMDPSKTVEGRATNLLKEGNQFTELAKRNAMLEGHRRGTLNTAGNIAAGQYAAMQSAIDIAKPDAAQSGQEALARQRQDQLMQTMETDFGYKMESMNQQQVYALETLTTQHGFNMEQLTSQLDFNKIALEANLGADERQMMTQTFGQMFNGMLNQIGNVMQSDLGANAKRDSVNEIYEYFQDWATSLSNLNMYEINWS